MIDQNILMGTLVPPEVEVTERIRQTDLPAGVVHTRHIEKGSTVVKFGVAADRPTEGTVYPVYFATDTFALSCWTGSVWKSVTLT
jgi:hypothetical protein